MCTVCIYGLPAAQSRIVRLTTAQHSLSMALVRRRRTETQKNRTYTYSLSHNPDKSRTPKNIARVRQGQVVEAHSANLFFFLSLQQTYFAHSHIIIINERASCRRDCVYIFGSGLMMMQRYVRIVWWCFFFVWIAGKFEFV